MPKAIVGRQPTRSRRAQRDRAPGAKTKLRKIETRETRKCRDLYLTREWRANVSQLPDGNKAPLSKRKRK